MEIYKNINSFEVEDEIGGSIFTEEDFNDIVSFIDGENSIEKYYVIIYDASPEHQQVISIDTSVSKPFGRNGIECHDCFVSGSILLPSINNGKPSQYEVVVDIIWEYTKDCRSFIKQFIGKEYVSDIDSVKIIGSESLVRDELECCLNILYGYESMFDIENLNGSVFG